MIGDVARTAGPQRAPAAPSQPAAQPNQTWFARVFARATTFLDNVATEVLNDGNSFLVDPSCFPTEKRESAGYGGSSSSSSSGGGGGSGGGGSGGGGGVLMRAKRTFDPRAVSPCPSWTMWLRRALVFVSVVGMFT
jgi:hypothetical protein